MFSPVAIVSRAMAGDESSGWAFLVNPGHPAAVDPAGALPGDALAAAPAGVTRHRGPVLPRQPLTAPCRLCGETRPLTREHIPPRATSYLGPQRGQRLEEWLSRDDLDSPMTGYPTQGGIWGYTLCEPCNSFTGREYGAEHKRWVYGARDLLRSMPEMLSNGTGVHTENAEEALRYLDQQLGWATFEARLKDLDGARFVRQVLSMMCSVAGPWRLTDQHPEVRRIVLDRAVIPLPEPLALVINLQVGSARIVGPTLVASSEGGWHWVCEVAYPPFAFLLVLARDGDSPVEGTNIGDLTELPFGSSSFQAPFQIGFAHTPFPGDWRTRAQIEDEARSC